MSGSRPGWRPSHTRKTVVRLESVQRKTGGRIHLTPRVPRKGQVTTLCGQGVWTSQGGVIVRMAGKNRDQFDELVFDGSVIVRRDGAGVRVRAGDVEVRQSRDGFEVRLKR